ncbi:amidohydrolase family protein [Flavihumibacter fluvii]|uniref:amidohydrolase family protein n=1 Tax=Flavihumibacter fluvii TaxID=2838157 RepID=UPI001BDF12F6|nr:amidohydrolase family protein [Flavihumibacter fluvii]ULQ51205.1 amidohydrolase family protein [Flavihumibacter fluvii]
MGYRKFKAGQLFTGKQFVPPDSVLVVRENGQIEAIIPDSEAGEDLQPVNGILSPGFINSHCHLELSHMKGLVPPGTGMVPFLLAIMQQRNARRENMEEAMAAAEGAMIDSGIVAVGDICNTGDTIIQKLKKRLTYVNFIECSGFVPAGAGSRFDAASQLLVQLSATGKSSIVPHAPYSVSPELFRLIDHASAGQIVTMHNQESAAENDFFLTGKSPFRQLFETLGVDIDFFSPPGKSSLQAVWQWLQQPGKLILVHNVVTSQEDLSVIPGHRDDVKQQPELFFCLCPNANQYINNTLPPVELLLANQCTITLGTDSLASNTQLNILEEINSLLKAFPVLNMETVLSWATLNGARALGISDRFGSFEKGKEPGLVQIENGKIRRIL